MNLPLLFARRYLLAKRSTNAVNVITGISIGVIAVVTAAMVIVLSAINGISELVETIYSPFDQDITITPTHGKTFPRDTLVLEGVAQRPGVEAASFVIEENVLLRCGGQQAVATLKGVEPQYMAMSRMADLLLMGEPTLKGPQGPTAILGIALRSDLDVPLDDGIFEPLEISAPIRGRKLSRYQQRAFGTVAVAMSGSFSVNLEFDARYALVPLDLASEVLQYDGAVSALELQLTAGTDRDRFAQELRTALGEGFLVRTRQQKNALMYQTNRTEKLVSFIILAFIALIGAFNIIASLTMLMIEKKDDMRTLMGLGATTRMVRRIFLNEGLLIVLAGVLLGLLLGLGVCVAQQRFGLVPLADSVVDAYPVKVMATDVLLVFAVVMAIGLLATAVPLRSLGQRFLYATAPKG